MFSKVISFVAMVLLVNLHINVAVPFLKRDATTTAEVLHNICQRMALASGVYPNPFDCRTFIACANGATTVEPCAKDLVYDKKMKVCNWGFVTPCDTDPTTQPPIVYYELDLCYQNHWPNGYYVDPFNCEKYIHCVHNITYVVGCTDNRRFDAFLMTCRDPDMVNCNNRPTSSPSN